MENSVDQSIQVYLYLRGEKMKSSQKYVVMAWL